MFYVFSQCTAETKMIMWIFTVVLLLRMVAKAPDDLISFRIMRREKGWEDKSIKPKIGRAENAASVSINWASDFLNHLAVNKSFSCFHVEPEFVVDVDRMVLHEYFRSSKNNLFVVASDRLQSIPHIKWCFKSNRMLTVKHKFVPIRKVSFGKPGKQTAKNLFKTF